MTDFPETRDSLLVQMQSPGNREAWDQFAQIYRPVIYRIARGRGLQDADAQDLAQRVLISVASSIGDWEKTDPSVRFRHWLRRVTRHAIINALTRRPHDRAAGGTSAQDRLAEHSESDQTSEAQIEKEYRRELYLQAAKLVRGDFEPKTWQAFEWTVVENRSIEQVAKELNLPVGSVYAARSRVMRRLRSVVQNLDRSESEPS